MSIEERVIRLEKNHTDPFIEIQTKCVFCNGRNSLWDLLLQQAYQKRIGKSVDSTVPCIHHQDSWLLWTSEAAGFIFGSFRDVAKNLEKKFVMDILGNKAKLNSQLDSYLEKWKSYSPWIEVYDRERNRKEKRYRYLEDINELADIEKKRIMKQRTKEYQKAKECLEYTEESAKTKF